MKKNIDFSEKSLDSDKKYINRNINTIIFFEEEFNFEKFTENMKKDWNVNIISNEDNNKILYSFIYNNLKFQIKCYNKKYEENIMYAFKNSRFAKKSKDIYLKHKNFCEISVFSSYQDIITEFLLKMKRKFSKKEEKNSIDNIKKIYVQNTEVIITFIESLKEECTVFDYLSEQFIDRNFYISKKFLMYESNIADALRFPISFYINYNFVKNESEIICETKGLKKFNAYEIQIVSNKLSKEQITEAANFIVFNIVSLNKELKNKSLILISVKKRNQETGIIKFQKSKISNEKIFKIKLHS